ncbi:MAG TPA: hypothetical protein ACFYED_03260 [Candidatus Tripitaka californicus]|uniref:hypothetical protein n=1 Tax=Candidatus Tripitaka californicus TaxID=3367616 RepID=UPI004024CAEC|nr:hypothetical protein [Planctomycetota bacterium]
MDPKTFRIVMIGSIAIMVMAAVINSCILIKRFHLLGWCEGVGATQRVAPTKP